MSKDSFIKSVSEKLNQPTSIAVMASVGIHAILGVSLPYVMPVFSREEPPLRQTVQVLELTPADLSRLPDLSVPSLPPYYQTPLSSQSLLPPQTPPDSRKSGSTFSLDPRQSFQIPLGGKQTDQRGSKRTAQKGKGEKQEQPQSRIVVPHKNPAMINLPLSGGRLASASLEQFESENQDTQSQGSSTTRMDSGTSERRNQERESQRGIAPPGEAFKHDIVAHNPQANHQSPTNENSDAQRPRPSQQNTHDLAGNSKPDSTSTDNQEVAPNNPTGRDGNTPTIEMPLAGTYPKEACSKKLSGTAVFGVLVGADSKIANIQVLQSAGELLDTQARRQINARRFENSTGQQKAYRVSVPFEYNNKICPSSSAPPDSPQSENSPEPENSPAARQTPKPENSPDAQETPDNE
ncbi:MULTISPECIES: energy transducer TonB [unclassified Coleofasciculus]|uniref:energy transducer TonB n=1 Tax=unclassified Coleofasciculus TaxID=2692782 RepID=UPI0018822EB3|nr:MULTISPECIES: energy transducer TonB [unclassified Coleofasciculus]MBE9127377.1 energy transducer TonB [Coleofasciculus sp. LEGE 07081]MBE9147357.1 energy transducer TonB [Coleofasciculus sp. LEGE 07092]